MPPSIPTLSHPHLINGLNDIPPPPSSSFDAEFSGLLPPGKSIRSAWGTTRYYSFPPKTSAPNPHKVLLCHGGGTCAVGLAPLANLISAGGNYDIVAYDLWGHGLSSTPLATHNPALMHAQILELLSHLQWTSEIHVLGFSMGGIIAASFCALHPQVAASCSLIAPAGLWKKSERSYWEAFSTDGGWGLEWLRRRKVMDFITGGKSEPRKDWKERWVSGEDLDTTAIQKWERENHGGWEASLTSLWNYGGVLDQHEWFEVLNETAVERLVVLGGSDTVIEPEYTKKELEKMGWKGKVEVVDGAAHGIVRSHVKEVAALVLDFWEKK